MYTTPAWALKFCDLKIRYCVEQKCKLPFNRIQKGILHAYEFFEKLGYYGKFDVNIVFEQEVLEVPASNKYVSKIRLLGKYQEDQKTIYMTCWGEKWLSERNDFDMEMTADFYETVITHEMIHLKGPMVHWPKRYWRDHIPRHPDRGPYIDFIRL